MLLLSFGFHPTNTERNQPQGGGQAKLQQGSIQFKYHVMAVEGNPKCIDPANRDMNGLGIVHQSTLTTPD